MPCPDCKGSSRTAIAPGYWQCTTLMWRDATSWGPMPGTPPHLGIMGPVPAAVQQPCGRRYHEAGGGNEVDVNSSCTCGIFAIGRCADCGSFVCGEHSALYEGRLTCASDIQRRRQEAAEAKQKADAEAQHRADHDRIDSLTGHVAKGADAIERWLLARTTNFATNDQYCRNRFYTEQAQRTAIDRVRALIEEAPGARSVNVAHSDVTTWSVETAALVQWLSMRRTPDTTLHAGLFRTYTGWRIGSGQTSGGYRDPGWSYDVVLRTDGCVSTVRRGTRKMNSYQVQNSPEFGQDGHIWQLAKYLNLI